MSAIRKAFATVIAVFMMSSAAVAQTPGAQTYADIRAELALLNDQIQGLRGELLTTGTAETGVSNATPILQRIGELEEALRRVTGQVEELGFRIDRVVADGTNRIGDLEFRLTELENGDIGALGQTRPLGEAPAPAPEAAPLPSTSETGAADTASPTGLDVLGTLRPRPRPGTGGAEIAPLAPATSTGGGDLSLAPQTQPTTSEVSSAQTPEAAAFDQALGDYRAGRYAEAANGFAQYMNIYSSSARTAEAAYWRGEALFAQGSWDTAARSYLDSYSAAPQGEKAPEALLRLGTSLGRLGNLSEACLTLNEIPQRFPGLGTDLAARVDSERRALSCQ